MKMVMMNSYELEIFISRYALFPRAVIELHGLHSFITSMFLHASFGHLIGNMWFLHIFGDNLEDKLGRIRYLTYYLTCGVVASLVQIIVEPFSTIPHLGASGAIAGIMGGYLLLFPKAKVEVLIPIGFFLHITTIPAYFMLFYWIFFQMIAGMWSIEAISSGGIAYFAHIGGFVSGIVTIKYFYRGRKRGWL